MKRVVTVVLCLVSVQAHAQIDGPTLGTISCRYFVFERQTHENITIFQTPDGTFKSVVPGYEEFVNLIMFVTDKEFYCTPVGIE